MALDKTGKTGGVTLGESMAALFSPRRVAVVGASPRSQYWRTLQANLRQYRGEVVLVNPHYASVDGAPCYPSLGEVPGPIDQVLCITPAAAVPGVIRESGAKGVKVVTVYASGFGERGQTALQAELEAAIRASGVRVSGPNGMGALSSASMFVGYTAPLLQDVMAGNVSLISHSGGSLGTWVRGAAERGLGVRHAVSSGNETDLNTTDYLEYFLEDEGTAVIVLQYLEAVGEGERFVELGREALRRGKPLLAVKAGRTPLAQARVMTHTGRVAPPERDFEAVARSLGILLFPTADAMLEAAVAFACGRLPKGPRVAVHAISGAVCNHMADLLTEGAAHLRLGEVSAPAREQLSALLAPWSDVANPLDSSWPGISSPETFFAINRILAGDPEIDLLLVEGELPHVGGAGRYRYARDAIRQLAAGGGAPVFFFSRMRYTPDPEAAAESKAWQVAYLQGSQHAVAAVDAMVGWLGRRARAAAPAATVADSGWRLEAGEVVAFEVVADLLRRHGLPVAEGQVVADVDQAVAFFNRLGRPIALKRVDLLHKSEAGAVALGLDGPAAIAKAFERLRQIPPGPGAAPVLYAQAMVSGAWEIFLGGHRSQFGPVVAVGLGGIWVEALQDTAVRLAPIDAEEARAMLRELRGWRLLQRNRQGQAADLDWLSEAMARFSTALCEAVAKGVGELEVNPLILQPAGGGGTVVDARAVGAATLAEKGGWPSG